MHRHAARHLLALGVYSLAALILTWPLVARIGTHVPGDGIDDPALAWNLWWIKSRLVNQLSTSIFDVDWMFHPVDINLAFYTLTPLNGLLSVPLQTALQLTIASNLLVLSSFVLSGYGAFLLAWHLQSMPPILTIGKTPLNRVSNEAVTAVALFAGLAYAFASAKLFYPALGQFNIASSQWIPFAALYVLRLGESRSQRAAVRNGALAGLFMAMQAWAELTYASFLLVFFFVYSMWWIVVKLSLRQADGVDRGGWSWTAFGSGVCASAAVFIAGIAPFLVAMGPDLVVEGDFFGSGGGFADVFSADLMGFLVPTRLHPVFGEFAAGLPFPNDKGQHIYVGYVLLALGALGVGAYGVRQKRQRTNIVWFWLTCAIVFWLLSLGPQLRWAGDALPVPGPFALVSRLPFFSGNRYPSRYGVMLVLSASALAVYGLRYTVDRVLPMIRIAHSRRQQKQATAALVASLGALMLFEHLSAPLPMSDFRTPSIYETLAYMPGDFAVLELPTGWRNGARVMGRSDVLIMMQQWYQTTHGKRRLGGNTSRNPPLKFQYFTDAPLMGELIALMNGDREHIAAALEPKIDTLTANSIEIAPDVLDFLGVEFALLHEERSPEALIRFVDEALPLELVETWRGTDWTGAPSTIRLYRTSSHAPAESWNVDLATPMGRLHLAAGWSALDVYEWRVRLATRATSTLLLNLPDEGGILSIDFAGIASAATLHLNGHPLGTQPISEAGPVEVTIGPGVADELVDRLEIRWHGEPAAIADLNELWRSESAIGELDGALPEDVTLAARSAGEEVGDFAHIYINGVDYSPNERGYNLVALGDAGEVLDARAFDTHGSHEASHEMAAWLRGWPEETVIVGAVADEASLNLDESAVEALSELGVTTDLRDMFRWSHAFAGVSGAPAGAALERSDLIRPASLSIGPPLDATHATGGIRRIAFRTSD